jgi:hypothetical protein
MTTKSLMAPAAGSFVDMRWYVMANLLWRREGLRRTWCALRGAAQALCAAAFLLASTVAAALPAVLAPSQLVDGTAVDGEALGTRLPLVLVHGLGGP